MASYPAAPRVYPGSRKTAVSVPAETPCEETQTARRFNLLEFLFPDRGLETFHEVEDGMQPSTVVYTRMGDSLVASRWSAPDRREG